MKAERQGQLQVVSVKLDSVSARLDSVDAGVNRLLQLHMK